MHAQKFRAYSDVWFIRLEYSRHTLNTLEVRQMYGTHSLAFQRIFCAYENYFINFHTLLILYVSLIRNSVTGPLHEKVLDHFRPQKSAFWQNLYQ